MKLPHLVETCLISEIESVLERMDDDYDLAAVSSHQVGTGYGAHVEALLIFRLRENPENHANGNGGQRRKMMPVIPLKKSC